MIAYFGPFGRILISKVSAVTLSPLIFNMMRSCAQASCHRSIATRMARHSQTCCPSGLAMEWPYLRSSLAVSLDAKYDVTLPLTESHPPSPQGDASVPISAVTPVRR